MSSVCITTPVKVCAEQASGGTLEWLGPPLLAAVVAVLVVLISSWVASKTTKDQLAQARREPAIAFAREQLNQYYGPLMLMRATSRELRQQLPDRGDDGREWRLVDHIAELHLPKNKRLRLIVEQILQLGDDIEKILTTRAGYANRLPAPASFAEYVSHHRLLRMHWEMKSNQPEDGRRPFPKELDDDIGRGYEEVRQRLESLLTS